MLRTWRNVTLLRDARTRALSSSSWTAGAGAARRCGRRAGVCFPYRPLWMGELGLPATRGKLCGWVWRVGVCGWGWVCLWVYVVQLPWGLWCLVRRRALAGWLFRGWVTCRDLLAGQGSGWARGPSVAAPCLPHGLCRGAGPHVAKRVRRQRQPGNPGAVERRREGRAARAGGVGRGHSWRRPAP